MTVPKYSPQGEMLCTSCGKPIEVGVSQRGDSMARCENPECKDTGTYEVGSFRHNPAPEIRQVLPPPLMTARYVWGFANYQVKDGKKVEDGH
jgi:hypothetical protein